MEKIECTCCQERVPASNLQSYDWGSYCLDCVEQYMYHCAVCGEIETNNFREEHGSDLCENCYNEKLYS